MPPDEKRKGHKVRESPRELVEPGWHSDLYRPETEVKQPGELLLDWWDKLTLAANTKFTNG